jgi:HD-like signal output (HDOD) protein
MAIAHKTEEKIKKIDQLPAFTLLYRVLQSMIRANDSGDIRELIAYIKNEPAVATKLISVANSPVFRRTDSIVSVEHAVTTLGLSKTQTVVLEIIASQSKVKNQCPSFNHGRYWHNSIALAITSSLVAKYSGLPANVNEAYLIGLLFRIGLLALIHLYPEQMDSVFKQSNGEPLRCRERTLLNGCDHYIAGHALFKHWQLPDQFCGIIESMSCFDEDLYPNYLVLYRAIDLLDSEFELQPNCFDGLLKLDQAALNSIKYEYQLEQQWISGLCDLK